MAENILSTRAPETMSTVWNLSLLNAGEEESQENVYLTVFTPDNQ